jgi:predicted HTH transcriptional regulator
LALVKEGEGETLEFKERFAEEKEILETICAFSNSRGGRILIAVDDHEKIKGVHSGKHVAELCEPPTSKGCGLPASPTGLAPRPRQKPGRGVEAPSPQA